MGIDLKGAFDHLSGIVAARPDLPSPLGVENDVKEVLRILAEPGPLLALSNGDTSPGNCRLTNEGMRFLDFEYACFRHVMLDVAALRFPFPGCPCWSHLPEELGLRAEETYRLSVAHACPAILDSTVYAQGIAAACVAWTIVRAGRLPKLEQSDEPHPLGFSRRGQLLDTITTTVSACEHSHSLPSLVSWLTSLHQALRARWPYLPPTQPLYPAFDCTSPR